MKEIIDQYSPILEATDTDSLKEKVKEKQKLIRLKKTNQSHQDDL